MLKAGKYPFIVEPESYLSRIIPGRALEVMARDRDYLELARMRLAAALLGDEGVGGRPRGLASEDEVASFYLALAAAAKASRLALTRFIEGELEGARRSMEDEDEDDLFDVAWRMGLRIERRLVKMPWVVDEAGKVTYRTLNMAARVDDVLRAIAGMQSLASMFVKDGWVYLDRKGLIDLLIGAAKRKLLRKAEELAGIDSEGLEALAVQARIAVGDAGLEEIGFIEDAVPECIRNLMDKASRGERLSDEELYVVATFLANTGAPSSLMASLLESSGLAPERLSKMIAEVLLREAKGYKPYSCRELVSRGICRRCPREGLLEWYRARARRMVLEKGLAPRRTG